MNEDCKMTLTVAPSPTFSTTDGRDIVMFPGVSECTVAQAAAFLDVSEHRINRLLDAERIAFQQKDGKRLVQQSSLLDFGERRARRRAALDEMAREDQEMGLYDD